MASSAAERGGGPGCLLAVVAAAEAELVEDAAWALGATAIGERPGDAGSVALDIGFDTPVAAREAAAELAARHPSARIELVDASAALDTAMDAWRAHARPVRVGGVHVRPPWLADDDEPPDPAEVVVVLDPSRAFGSGSHPSTRACLAIVGERARPGASVLDVGCGSGVLAVAAARLGARRVVAIDIDDSAVAATVANAQANDVAAVVDASTASIDDAAPGGERFDLVLANIGARTLRELAPSIVERAAPGGAVVLAGLLAEQAQTTAAAFAPLDVHEIRLDDGPEGGGATWAAVVLVAPSTIARP